MDREVPTIDTSLGSTVGYGKGKVGLLSHRKDNARRCMTSMSLFLLTGLTQLLGSMSVIVLAIIEETVELHSCQVLPLHGINLPTLQDFCSLELSFRAGR